MSTQAKTYSELKREPYPFSAWCEDLDLRLTEMKASNGYFAVLLSGAYTHEGQGIAVAHQSSFAHAVQALFHRLQKMGEIRVQARRADGKYPSPWIVPMPIPSNLVIA